jgi:hypothetical protein
MLFILDTNAFHHNWQFSSESSKAFLDYVSKTQSKIAMPRVVWDEIRKNHREELKGKIEIYAKAAKHLSSVLPNKTEFVIFPEDSTELDEMTEEYMQGLMSKLGLSDSDFIEYENIFLERVTKRAIYWKKPFIKENQKAYKDSLIWEMVLERSKLPNPKPKGQVEEVTFITNNSKDFSQNGENQALHSDLEADLKLVGRTSGNDFYYYNTLENFIENHYQVIKSIDYNKIDAHIQSSKYVIDDLFESFDENEQMIKRDLAGKTKYVYEPNMRQFKRNAKISRFELLNSYAYEYQKSQKIIAFMNYKVTVETRFSYFDWEEKLPDESYATIIYEVGFSITFEGDAFNEPEIENFKASTENITFEKVENFDIFDSDYFYDLNES